MATSWKLPKSWPSTVRDILLDGARDYYRLMNEEWPDPAGAMDRVMESVNYELERRQEEIYEKASPRWLDRWERGEFEADIKKAIEETYRRLRRSEGGVVRSHASVRKKNSQQLDAEIAQALRRRLR